MKIGKLNISDLENLVLKNISCQNENILSTGEIGNDCSAVKIDDKILYLSSDPITGATKNIGSLALNVNANDIATTGVEPLGIMLTILLPPNIKECEISEIMREVQSEADKLGVTILGGHTEITDAVNRIVISSTVIGVGENIHFKSKDKVVSGDRIVITKGVGIEGAGIISFEKERELKSILSESILEKAKNLLNSISVVKEGVISKTLSKGMHDVTEGGLLGALWEMSYFYNLGIEIEYDKIYIPEEVKAITDFYKIDPLKLISSGTMVIVVDEKNLKNLLKKLEDNRIKAFDIGYFTSDERKILIKDGKAEEIVPPDSDELYKIL